MADIRILLTFYISTVSVDPPEGDPVLTGYTENEILYESSTDLPLTCTQQGGNPLADITWNCVGQTGTTGVGNSTHTVSTVMVPRDRSINKQTCTCIARSPDTNITFEKSSSVLFTIHYGPTQRPRLTGYTGEILYEGDADVSILCHQVGGFPLCDLTWNCFGLSGTPMTSSADEVVSEVKLATSRNYNSRNCTCTATHSDSNVQYEESTFITVLVYYPPSSPSITPSPTYPWLEESSGSPTCNYSNGFPSSTRVEWFRDGNLLESETADSINLTTLSSMDDKALYTCRVHNTFTDTKARNLTSPGSALNVEYKPVMVLNASYLTPTEGESSVINCDTHGNPPPTVRWLRGSTVIQTGHGTSLTLVLTDIHRTATDNYTCHAESSSTVHGKLVTEKHVQIQVLYPPDVSVEVPDAKEGNTDIRIHCVTKGEPNTVSVVSWTQSIGQTIIQTTEDFMYESSTRNIIVIPVVSFEDTGTYTCSTTNDIADRQGQKIQSNSTVFMVTGSAKFSSPGSNDAFYGKIHDTLIVKIPFYSYPLVTSKADLEWENLTANEQIAESTNLTFDLVNTETIRLSVKGIIVEFVGQAAVMTVSSYDKSMTGNYSITVYNDGKTQQSTTYFWLKPSELPEIPTKFEFVSSTSTSITLTWKKGFNGGHSQTFVILYQPKGVKQTETVYVEESQQVVYTYIIGSLKSCTWYVFTIYSTNQRGNSSDINGNRIEGQTQKEEIHIAEENKTPNTASVVLFSLSAVMLCFSVGLATFVIYQKRNGVLCMRREKQDKEGFSQRRGDAELHEHNRGDRYETIGRPSAPNVYEELAQPQVVGEQNSAERANTYEVLGRPAAPNVYEKLSPHRGERDPQYMNTAI